LGAIIIGFLYKVGHIVVYIEFHSLENSLDNPTEIAAFSIFMLLLHDAHTSPLLTISSTR
jgi:hypothetical protein